MTNLYFKIISEHEFIAQRASESPGEGWHLVDREPDIIGGEYLEQVGNTVVIKKREKTPEQIAAEEKTKTDASLFTPAMFAALVKRVEELEKQKG